MSVKTTMQSHEVALLVSSRAADNNTCKSALPRQRQNSMILNNVEMLLGLFWEQNDRLEWSGYAKSTSKSSGNIFFLCANCFRHFKSHLTCIYMESKSNCFRFDIGIVNYSMRACAYDLMRVLPRGLWPYDKTKCPISPIKFAKYLATLCKEV